MIAVATDTVFWLLTLGVVVTRLTTARTYLLSLAKLPIMSEPVVAFKAP